MEPAGRLAAQLWISEEGSPVAALSSLMVLTGRIGDEEVVVVASGDDDDDEDDGVIGEDGVGGGREGLAAVATTLPSSRRERLNPGSYEVDPEICGRKFRKYVFLRYSTALVETNGTCGRQRQSGMHLASLLTTTN